MRIAARVHALDQLEGVTFLGEESSTYNTPVANTAETPIFFFVRICKSLTPIMGRESTRISPTKLPTEPTTPGIIGLTHVPGNVWFQSLWIGLHGKIEMKETVKE